MDSSLKYWNHMIYPIFILFDIRPNHFSWLDKSYRITVKLYLAERSVYMNMIRSFAAKQKDKSICSLSSHLFMKACKMKPVAFIIFLIFLWLIHFQVSKEGFSTQPTEASFHWGYKTSLILCSKTYISKMVTYSNAHQPSASGKMQRNVMSQLCSIELL